MSRPVFFSDFATFQASRPDQNDFRRTNDDKGQDNDPMTMEIR